jgi:hypothetical protein
MLLAAAADVADPEFWIVELADPDTEEETIE